MSQKLGQHFLKNKLLLEKTAQLIGINSGDVIIEIGPGHGELTKEILKNGNKNNFTLIAIERDRSLVKALKTDVKDERLEIVEGDALRVIPGVVDKIKSEGGHYSIIGNIPYYITGHLLKIIENQEIRPDKVVLLIQKEVAQRICQKSPYSSLLSLSVQYWGSPEIALEVSKDDFSPPPKVNSAVITIKTGKIKKTGKEADYYLFIKNAFKHPRKTLLNNLLSAGFSKESIFRALSSLNFSEKSRPAVLGVADVEKMIKMLY